MKDPTKAALTAIKTLRALPADQRVAAYNQVQEALGALVADLAPDPACSPRLLPAASVRGNDYNPNKTAPTELDLLEQSMRADGITMALVVMPEEDGGAIVVDGFHRRAVAVDRLAREYVPCAFIARPLVERMASTVRHNRARGKHEVELMGALVREMLRLGLPDDQIASRLGMSVEELVRLKQTVGAASMLASKEYGRAWRGRDGEDEQ